MVASDNGQQYELGGEICISSRLKIAQQTASADAKKAQQLESLVKFASQNILDSFNNEIGQLLVSRPPAQRADDENDEIRVIDEEDLDLDQVQALKDWPGGAQGAGEVLSQDAVRELEQAVRDAWLQQEPASSTAEGVGEAKAKEVQEQEEEEEELGLAGSIEGDMDAIAPFVRDRVRGSGGGSDGGDSLRRQLKQMQEQSRSRIHAQPKAQAQAQAQGSGSETLRLERFQDRGVEEQALEELNRLVENTRREGFAQALMEATGHPSPPSSPPADQGEGEEEGEGVGESSAARAAAAPMSVQGLMQEGSRISSQSIAELLSRPPVQPEDLSIPASTFPVDLKAGGLRGGIDVFEGPPVDPAYVPPSSALGQQMAAERERQSRGNTSASASPAEQKLQEAVGMAVPDRFTLRRDINRLELLISDLGRLPGEMHGEVLDSFKDLMLADNFLFLLKAANVTVRDEPTRRVLGVIASRASDLALDLGMLIKAESVRHLDTISKICEVSARFQDDEAQFLDRLELLRPRFDSDLLAYLKFAIAEEEQVIVARGSDFERFPSQWLQVLRVVQRGVRADVERRFDRLLEPVLLVLRFKDYALQEDIFQRFLAQTADVDALYMRQLCRNLVEGMAISVRSGEFDRAVSKRRPTGPPSGASGVSPEGRRMLRHLRRFSQIVEKHLSDDEAQRRFARVEAEAASQGQEVVRLHRNPLAQQQIEQQQQRDQEERDELLGESLITRTLSTGTGTENGEK